MKIAHHNGKLLSPSTLKISTVELPFSHCGDYYETCAFIYSPKPGLRRKTTATVLERYTTESEAVLGHAKWCAHYGVDKPC